jgi:hypothetical protein
MNKKSQFSKFLKKPTSKFIIVFSLSLIIFLIILLPKDFKGNRNILDFFELALPHILISIFFSFLIGFFLPLIYELVKLKPIHSKRMIDKQEKKISSQLLISYIPFFIITLLVMFFTGMVIINILDYIDQSSDLSFTPDSNAGILMQGPHYQVISVGQRALGDMGEGILYLIAIIIGSSPSWLPFLIFTFCILYPFKWITDHLVVRFISDANMDYPITKIKESTDGLSMGAAIIGFFVLAITIAFTDSKLMTDFITAHSNTLLNVFDYQVIIGRVLLVLLLIRWFIKTSNKVKNKKELLVK